MDGASTHRNSAMRAVSVVGSRCSMAGTRVLFINESCCGICVDDVQAGQISANEIRKEQPPYSPLRLVAHRLDHCAGEAGTRLFGRFGDGGRGWGKRVGLVGKRVWAGISW